MERPLGFEKTELGSGTGFLLQVQMLQVPRRRWEQLGINLVNFPLRSRPFICYKQFTESRRVASRAIFATLVAVRHLISKRTSIVLNCPGHGT